MVFWDVMGGLHFERQGKVMPDGDGVALFDILEPTMRWLSIPEVRIRGLLIEFEPSPQPIVVGSESVFQCKVTRN